MKDLLSYEKVIVVIPRSVRGIVCAMLVAKKKEVIITNGHYITRRDFERIKGLKSKNTAVVYINMRPYKEYYKDMNNDMDNIFIMNKIDAMFMIAVDEVAYIVPTDDIIETVYENTIFTPTKKSVKDMGRHFYKDIKSIYWRYGNDLREYIIVNPTLKFRDYKKYVESMFE